MNYLHTFRFITINPLWTTLRNYMYFFEKKSFLAHYVSRLENKIYILFLHPTVKIYRQCQNLTFRFIFKNILKFLYIIRFALIFKIKL